MEQTKKTYYVDPGRKELLPEGAEREGHFRIFVTDEELEYFKMVFNESYSAEIDTFLRAHIPYIEYHISPENDHYDRTLIGLYGLIYLFGDEEAKHHVKEMGILKGNTLNNEPGY
ncbi:MAG TPA: hypothetical protein VEY51_02615 [Chondromyces sp.]|nr:hypothetical protein [Chondromyces sp.]